MAGLDLAFAGLDSALRQDPPAARLRRHKKDGNGFILDIEWNDSDPVQFLHPLAVACDRRLDRAWRTLPRILHATTSFGSLFEAASFYSITDSSRTLSSATGPLPRFRSRTQPADPKTVEIIQERVRYLTSSISTR